MFCTSAIVSVARWVRARFSLRFAAGRKGKTLSRADKKKQWNIGTTVTAQSSPPEMERLNLL
jgi:hypothetical protein